MQAELLHRRGVQLAAADTLRRLGKNGLDGKDTGGSSGAVPTHRRGAGKRSAGDARWLQQVRRAGTTTDRLAALALLLREAPLQNLRALDDLLKLAAKRSGYRGIAGEVGSKLRRRLRSMTGRVLETHLQRAG